MNGKDIEQSTIITCLNTVYSLMILNSECLFAQNMPYMTFTFLPWHLEIGLV